MKHVVATLFVSLFALAACSGGTEVSTNAPQGEVGTVPDSQAQDAETLRVEVWVEQISEVAKDAVAGDAPDVAGVDVADAAIPEICTPQCAGLECGDDGCGGACGSCPAAAPECVDGLCVAECQEDCEGKECGDDGCGGQCGSCPGAAPLCVNGICEADCTPECDGLECGEDGCGGECGTCPGAAPVCVDGICQVDCTADCGGSECGDDGCGGTCGDCNAGYVCSEGQCEAKCELLCDGRECGAVGEDQECLCGTCADDDPCTEDICTELGMCSYPDNMAPCDDGNPCTTEDTCVGGYCGGELLPLEELAELSCVCLEDAHCEAVENGDICDGTLTCQGSQEGLGICELDPDTVLNCEDGNPCTDDSCDALVGCVNAADDTNPCADDDLCNGEETCQAGICEAGVVPDCDDADKCTTDTCDPSAGCGHILAAGICDDELMCTDDACEANDCTNELQPYYCVIGGGCVPSGAENPENPCEKCVSNLLTSGWSYLGDGVACGAGKVCHEGTCCDHVAACVGLDCGSDGCGGNCGVCGAGFVCGDGQCLEIECVPNCLAKACGPDGCEGSCGDCQENEICTVQGDCLCLPACAGKQCGADGCGGVCGVCQAGFNCVQGGCECVPQCQDKECGPDLCGGECGGCGDNEDCKAGVCESLGGPDSCVGHCGTASENCYCDDLCFLLGACCDDVCDACPDLENCTCGDDICDPLVDEDCDNCPEDCGCACGEECNGGVCDSVACLNKECGDNGCDGSCGDCSGADNLPCASASCVDFNCQVEVANFYCVIADSCVPSGTINPDNECEKCSPNDDKLNWSAVSNGIGCGAGLACHDGLCCNYDCDGKVCGDDGCGGTCGDCEGAGTCCGGSCAECCDGNDLSGDGCYQGLISEFLVHPEDGGRHSHPDVATAPDGSSLICWTAIEVGDSNGPVVCRLYDAAGVPTGYPAALSGDSGTYADVAPLADGGWVVVWYGAGPTGTDIFSRLLGANGLPASSVFQVNTKLPLDDHSPHVAGLESGGFVVVWDKAYKTQYMQLFFANGTKAGGEKMLDYPSTSGDVAAFPGGSFLATWKNDGVWQGRVYLDDGSVDVATFELADKSPGDVAALASDLVALLHSPNGPSYFTVTKAGETVDEGGALTTLVETYSLPAIARLTEDAFVAVWVGWNHVYMRKVGPDGPIGDQEKADRLPQKKRYPSVAGYSDGSYIVVWHADVSGVCTACRVYAQRFDKDGNRILH